jgi:hypothetical protein
VAARKTTASKAAKDADDSTPPVAEEAADQGVADGNGAADDGSAPATQEESPGGAAGGQEGDGRADEEGTPPADAGSADPMPDLPDAPCGPEAEICRVCFPGWERLGPDVTAVGCEHGSYKRAPDAS